MKTKSVQDKKIPHKAIRALVKARLMETITVSERTIPSHYSWIDADRYVAGYNAAVRKMRELVDSTLNAT
jgi:hypothetical protein